MKKKTLSVAIEILPRDLPDSLRALASEVRSPLSLVEVAALVEERVGPLAGTTLLEAALARSPEFAQVRRKSFVSREVLLQRACFRIEPRAEEVRAGILVPGHRFVPLWWGADTENLAVEDADGRTVPYTDLTMPFSQAFPYHYLLGYSWLPDSVEGRDLTGDCALRVLDLSDFYGRNEFVAGDFILAEIRDPWARKVVLRHVSRHEALADVATLRASDVALEKAFLRMLKKPHILWSIPEQLFQALAEAPAFVRRKPGSTFERFLTRTPSISLQEVGIEMAAFPKDTSPFQLALHRMAHENDVPDVFADPIDQLLARLGVNLHAASIEGLLRLAASQEKTFVEVMDEIIPWDRISHSSLNDMKELRDHLKKLWDAALRHERQEPLSPNLAALLARAADLKNHVLKILRHLDFLGFTADQLPSRPLLRMVEIDELAECILQLDFGADEPSRKIKSLEELLGDVEHHLDRLQEEILSEALV